MRNLIDTYKTIFKDRRYVISLIVSFAALAGALVVNYYASIYATDRVSNSVTDIVLSNIPVYNVAIIFLLGPFILWAILSIFMITKPTSVPFALKSIAIFIITRSVFISLTHLGPFPDQVSLAAAGSTLTNMWDVHTNPNFLAFGSGGDLFFSGHTGLPFLMGLIYWENKSVRILCLVASVFFGIIVLLGHLHYTIDVLSAFFITYGTYEIGRRMFKKDAIRASEAVS